MRFLRDNEQVIPLWRDLEVSSGNIDLCLLITHTITFFIIIFFVSSWWSVFSAGKLLQVTEGLLWPGTSEETLIPPRILLGKVYRDRSTGALYLLYLQGHSKKRGAHGEAAYPYALYETSFPVDVALLSTHFRMCNKSLFFSNLTLTYLYHGCICRSKHSLYIFVCADIVEPGFLLYSCHIRLTKKSYLLWKGFLE